MRDNGVGFEPDRASSLFEAFPRRSAPDALDGAGIGLAIVRRVVERHGGRVWAEGRVGEGATFFFTLGAKARVDADAAPIADAGPITDAAPTAAAVPPAAGAGPAVADETAAVVSTDATPSA